MEKPKLRTTTFPKAIPVGKECHIVIRNDKGKVEIFIEAFETEGD